MASKLETLKQDVAELYRLVALSERRRVQDILTIEAKKIETEITLLQQQNEGRVKSINANANTSAKRSYDVKLTSFGWDQSDSAVKIFVTLANVETLPSENIRCTFTETSFDVRVNELENKNYVLSQKNLTDAIQTEKCNWKVKPGKIIITLPKKSQTRWGELTKLESTDKKKKLPKMDEDTSDPTAGIMNLMKQMYEDGDDEMKRTILKAWTESREKNMNVDL